MSDSIGLEFSPPGSEAREILMKGPKRMGDIISILREKVKEGVDAICLQGVDSSSEGYPEFLEFLRVIEDEYGYEHISNIPLESEESCLYIIFPGNRKREGHIGMKGELKSRSQAIILDKDFLLVNVHLPESFTHELLADLDEIISIPEERRKVVKKMFVVGDFGKTPEELGINLWFRSTMMASYYRKYYISNTDVSIMTDDEIEEAAHILDFTDRSFPEEDYTAFIERMNKKGEKLWISLEETETLKQVDNALYRGIKPKGVSFLPARGLERFVEYPNSEFPSDHAMIEYQFN